VKLLSVDSYVVEIEHVVLESIAGSGVTRIVSGVRQRYRTKFVNEFLNSLGKLHESRTDEEVGRQIK